MSLVFSAVFSAPISRQGRSTKKAARFISMNLHLGGYQIAELLDRITRSFYNRRQPAIPANNPSLRSVGHQAFFRPVNHSEAMSHGLYIGDSAGKKTPHRRICLPDAGISGEHLRGIILRINGHRKEHQVLAGEAPLQPGEISGKPWANVGKRASRINKVDGHDLSP